MAAASTLAIASIAATVIGAGVSAYGQMKAGESAQNQANYAAGVARNNQIIADQQATASRQRGEVAATTQRLRTEALIGKQKAAMAANGLDVNSGSNLDLTTTSEQVGYLDALTIRSNAEREAYGFANQGRSYGGQAAMSSAAAANAPDAALLGTASSILGGAASLTDKSLKFNQSGIKYNDVIK